MMFPYVSLIFFPSFAFSPSFYPAKKIASPPCRSTPRHLIRQCLGLAQRAGANGRNVATRRNHPAGEIVADATSAQDAPAHTLRHGGGPCAKPL